MIDLEIVLTRLEGALRDINEANAGQLSEDDRISIAEMIVNLQMQLGMLDEAARVQFEPRLNALKTVASAVNIEWQAA